MFIAGLNYFCEFFPLLDRRFSRSKRHHTLYPICKTKAIYTTANIICALKVKIGFELKKVMIKYSSMDAIIVASKSFKSNVITFLIYGFMINLCHEALDFK